MNRWYVVDTTTGERFHPGHLEETEAHISAAQKTMDHDEDIPDRFQVQSDAGTVSASVFPGQRARRG